MRIGFSVLVIGYLTATLITICSNTNQTIVFWNTGTYSCPNYTCYLDQLGIMVQELHSDSSRLGYKVSTV